MKKRILTGLLTFVLLLALLPVPAQASEALTGGIFDVRFGRGMVLDCQRLVSANMGTDGYEISANNFQLPYSAVRNWPTDLGTDYLKLEYVGVRSDMGDNDTGKALDNLISGAGADAPIFKLVRYTKDGASVGDFSNVGYAVYCGNGLCLFSAIDGGAAYNSYGYFLQAKIEYGGGLKDRYSGTTDKTLTESLADMEALSGIKPLVINQGTRDEVTLYISDGDTVGAIKAQLQAKSVLPRDITLFSGGQELADGAVISSGADITAVFGSYTISTPDELMRFRDAVNGGNTFEGKTVKLTADIAVNLNVLKGDGSLNEGGFTEWTPIGNFDNPFQGAFDGQGHTVSGLYFNNTSDNPENKYVGLFGCIQRGGAIQNVGVTDSYIHGRESVGGVCGESYGAIEGCWNGSTVIGQNQYVGGVCGFNMGTVSFCRSTGTVSGGNRVGGVCGTSGNNAGKIENCRNTGAASGNANVGGVCGYIEDGLLTSSCSTGEVSGSSYTGGVCGRQVGNGRIENCYFDSDTCHTDDPSAGVTGKTTAEFASGEVAHLLQGEGETRIWGQTLSGDNADPYPVLTDDTAKGVYRIVFKTQPGAEDDYAVVYANPDGVGADRMPETPTSGTKRFVKWTISPAGNEEFTAGTAVTRDVTVCAQWKANSSEGGTTPTPPDNPPAPVAWENPFTDVTETDWFYASVEHVCRNGLFYGTSSTTFSPNDDTTRGMLAAVLYRLAKEPGTTAGNLFSDVADDKYYTGAISWAAENKIVVGYGNGRYGPEDSITREQLATILWRYDGSPESTGKLDSFTDGNKASEYAVPALQWAVDREIIRGRGNGILDPRGNATRAEVAAMLQRYLQKAER